MKIVINQKSIIIILLIAVLILASYIGYDEIGGYLTRKTYNAYSKGYSDGVSDTVQKLMEESELCGIVPVYYENTTKNMIDIECIMPENPIPENITS